MGRQFGSRSARGATADFLWIIYLAVGALFCALYLFVPPLKGSGPVINLLGGSGIVAVAVGIRCHRPTSPAAWWLFFVGLLLFWGGDVYTYSYPKLTGASVPFPSFGDALYLAVYPVLMAGLLILARRRKRRRNGPGLIDAAIMILGLSLVSAILLIAPYVHDHQMTLVPKLVSIGYPMGDILMLAAAILLAVDGGKRPRSLSLLLSSIVVLLGTDFVYGLMTLHNTYNHQLFLDAGWIFFYLLWGAAALHPSMRDLERSTVDHQPKLTTLRLVMLAGCSLVAPALEVAKAVRAGDSDMLFLIGASVVLTALVVGRMTGLVRQRERSVKRESALRVAASTLAAAGSRADVAAVALELVGGLVGGAAKARICRVEGHSVHVAGLNSGGDLSLWIASGLLARALEGHDAGVLSLAGHARRELRLDEHSASALVLELPVGDGHNLLLVIAGQSAAATETLDALQTLCSQIAMALQRARLSDEVHRQTSEARLSSLVQNSTDLITVVNADATILYQSPSVERVLGFAADDLIGGSLEALLHPTEQRRLLIRLADGIAARDQPELIECALRDHEGNPRQFEILATNLLEDAAVNGIVLNGRDVTERKKIEQQLADQAFRDPVTHLANRALFNERVRHAVARARREHMGLAVVFMDLDDFKTVNDSLGHAAGDALLREIAHRISASIRAADTAARFGGDEFALLLEDVNDPQATAETAERICEALARPVTIEEQEIVVRASLGISMAPAGTATDADELIRNADAAMYIAKAEGKGGYRMFEPAMHQRVLARLELRADLQRALDNHEFELHYQPVVRLRDNAIMGVEALVRWHHPVRGMVSPTEFIPFAEETGLIVPLGRWVLREGCRQARILRDRATGEVLPTISINLSVKQLFNSDIVADVQGALADAGLPASALTLEITESVMMTDTELAVQRLSELRDLGVRLAMDDFGTGYSSLSYLSRFPLDILKMDRSLLAAGAGSVTSGLATAVLGLGETFALEVVAEGIESAEQSRTLTELGCELGQGFLFARPMGAHNLLGFLDGRDALHPERSPALEA